MHLEEEGGFGWAGVARRMRRGVGVDVDVG